MRNNNNKNNKKIRENVIRYINKSNLNRTIKCGIGKYAKIINYTHRSTYITIFNAYFFFFFTCYLLFCVVLLFGSAFFQFFLFIFKLNEKSEMLIMNTEREKKGYICVQ